MGSMISGLTSDQRFDQFFPQLSLTVTTTDISKEKDLVKMPSVGEYGNRERTLGIPAEILIAESLLGTFA